MTSTTILDALKISLQHLMRSFWKEIDNLNASNISLAVLGLVRYGGRRQSAVVDELYKSLMTKQLVNGSWMNELWGTGLAILAAYEYSQSQGKQLNYRNPQIRNALEYIKTTQNHLRLNWQGEYYETLLLSWVFLKIGYEGEREFIKGVVGRLKKLQAPEGCLFDVYDTAIAACVFKAAQEKLEMDNTSNLESALQWLRLWEPEKESVWNRVFTLLAISEMGLKEDQWTESLLDSIISELESGMFSEDHDELAMTVLALASFLGTGPRERSDNSRISVDCLRGVANYGQFLRMSREKLHGLMQSVNSLGRREKVFSYTGAFVGNWTTLFVPIESHDQFKNLLASFYMAFYEGSGGGKRIPPELVHDDSVLFKIKHLRTSVQHDFEHGSDSEIEKKAKLIQSVYQTCCGKLYPGEIEDFRLVHVYLLQETERFLGNFH